MKFYAYAGLDEFLLQAFFSGRRERVFVDIGARDGETHNNTAFFERSMGWRGLCLEPAPDLAAKLKSARRVFCVQADFALTPSLLEKHGLVDIDYLALDARAVAAGVLQKLDWKQIRVGVL